MAVGNGDISCRISKTEKGLHLYVNNLTDYVDLSWGNYQRNIKIPGFYSGEVTLRMTIK